MRQRSPVEKSVSLATAAEAGGRDSVFIQADDEAAGSDQGIRMWQKAEDSQHVAAGYWSA